MKKIIGYFIIIIIFGGLLCAMVRVYGFWNTVAGVLASIIVCLLIELAINIIKD